MNADSVRIESDEHGFELHVVDEDGIHHSWNIHGIAEEVYDTVKREIGPWLQERDLAKASYDRGEGPNGEPHGTWEDARSLDAEVEARIRDEADRHEARIAAYRCNDPEGEWMREQADLANKARKENP